MNASTIENISTIFGTQTSKELLFCDGKKKDLFCSYCLYFSNSTFHAKKIEFILFINGRLVECRPLKKAISDLYANFLPKKTHPFVYISLNVRPDKLDVNIHPTKHQVQHTWLIFADDSR